MRCSVLFRNTRPSPNSSVGAQKSSTRNRCRRVKSSSSVKCSKACWRERMNSKPGLSQPQRFKGIQHVKSCVIGMTGPGSKGNRTPRAPSWCQLWGWYCGFGTWHGANFFRSQDCSMLQVHSQPITRENNGARPATNRGSTNSSQLAYPKSSSALRGTEWEKGLK